MTRQTKNLSKFWRDYLYYDSTHFAGYCLPFIVFTMSKKNKIALVLVGAGLLSAIILSYHLPPEKLTIALTGPTAVIGAGLAEWSSSSKDD